MRTDLARTSRPSSASTVRRLLTFSQDGNATGIYGGKVASSFLRDAVSGGDSVDVITIGDSNTGYSQGGFGGGGGGWTRGWLRAMNDAGIQTYSSPQMPIMAGSGVTASVQNVREDDGTTITTTAGYFGNVLAPYGSVARGSASGPAAVTTMLVPGSTFLPYSLSNFDYAYIPSGSSAQTFGQLNGTYPGGSAPNPALPSWNSPGQNLKYRVVYVASSTAGGSINPTIYRVTGGSYVSLATKSQTTYNASGNILSETDLDFTMPTTSPASAIIFGWNYIGFGYGPCQIAFDSVYKVTRGCAVNQLHYGSGQSVATISSVISGATTGGSTFLRSYLTSIIRRQQSAGGSGKVIIWINYGINSPTTGPLFVSGTASAISTISSEWSAMGGNPNNIAFVCSATHPLDADYGGTTEASLAENRTYLNAYASGLRNVTAVDFSALINASQMTSSGYYSGAGANEAHLSQAGYYELSKRMVNALIASA